MVFNYVDQRLRGLTVFAFYDRISHTSEALSGSGTSWTFSNTPVSQQGLRLIGTNDSGTGFILNYELEPISGVLTLPASWSGVTANYNQYSGSIQFLVETGTWDPKFKAPISRQDMYDNHHTNETNMKPYQVDFSVVKTTRGEQVLNYIADMVIRARWFLLMDPRSEKAYEGPLISARSFSVEKGYDPFIPAYIMVNHFGSFDIDGNSGSGVVDWTAYDN